MLFRNLEENNILCLCACWCCKFYQRPCFERFQVIDLEIKQQRHRSTDSAESQRIAGPSSRALTFGLVFSMNLVAASQISKASQRGIQFFAGCMWNKSSCIFWAEGIFAHLCPMKTYSLCIAEGISKMPQRATQNHGEAFSPNHHPKEAEDMLFGNRKRSFKRLSRAFLKTELVSAYKSTSKKNMSLSMCFCLDCFAGCGRGCCCCCCCCCCCFSCTCNVWWCLNLNNNVPGVRECGWVWYIWFSHLDECWGVFYVDGLWTSNSSFRPGGMAAGASWKQIPREVSKDQLPRLRSRDEVPEKPGKPMMATDPTVTQSTVATMAGEELSQVVFFDVRCV